MNKKPSALHILLLMLLSGSLYGQTQVNLKTQGRAVDFSRATSTLPVQTGTALPGSCVVGALFFLTSAPAGANLYACVAADTWSLETSGMSSSGGSGAPTGACSLRAVYDDTVNGNTWFCQEGTWRKALTTNNTGSFLLTGQNGDATAVPMTGQTSLYFSSTAKIAQSVDDDGNKGTMVRPMDCAGSGQLVQKIGADGSVTCATAGGYAASAPYLYFPFPITSLNGSTVVPQNGAVRYWSFTALISQTIDHLVAAETGSGSNHLAFALYRSDCTLLAGGSSGTFTGGSSLSLGLSSSLVAGTTYMLALSSDSANGTDTSTSTGFGNGMGAFVNSAGTYNFDGSNAAVWTSGTVVFPNNCGTRSAANIDPPAVLFY